MNKAENAKALLINKLTCSTCVWYDETYCESGVKYGVCYQDKYIQSVQNGDGCIHWQIFNVQKRQNPYC